MGDTVETNVERTQWLGYDPEGAVELLARKDEEIAELQTIVDYLDDQLDHKRRTLDDTERSAEAIRNRLVVDGVLPAS